ncbi:hypothetical protein V1506DRAFT_546690 [Lipomyces tetrasporus]
MELELEQTGSVVITGDVFHVKENYEQGIHPGTLTRDFNNWYRSRNYIRILVQRKKAKVVLGHAPSYFHGNNHSLRYRVYVLGARIIIYKGASVAAGFMQ